MLNAWQPDGNRAIGRFIDPTWNEQSEEWLQLDARLPPDHLARRIDRVVQCLDLTPLIDSYAGVGRKALPPDLMVKIVLYEIHSKKLSPAQWSRDVREHEPLRWLARGVAPSRTRLYEFRNRIAPYVDDWNAATLARAIDENVTPVCRGALDGSFVAAAASRRQLANEQRLTRRRRLVQAALLGQLQNCERPDWLASTLPGLARQKRTYDGAAYILCGRLELNQRRRSCKRKPPDKVLVSLTDPESALGRDKFDVFRPLYNVQLLCDLDSPLILSYDTLAITHDAGQVGPMLERTADLTGRKVSQLLADSGYVSLRDVETCETAGVELFAPWQENSYSEKLGKKKASNQFTQIPKTEFLWRTEEQTFVCPEGHRLQFQSTKKERRLDYDVTLRLYACPPEYCCACLRQTECTPRPEKGRTVSRLENEELLDSLRERMQTPEAKTLYKLRARTVELAYADMKEHRGLRRFRSRSLLRARTQVALVVLVHNLLTVDRILDQRLVEDKTVVTLTAVA